jgi:hypothetical protein
MGGGDGERGVCATGSEVAFEGITSAVGALCSEAQAQNKMLLAIIIMVFTVFIFLSCRAKLLLATAWKF